MTPSRAAMSFFTAIWIRPNKIDIHPLKTSCYTAMSQTVCNLVDQLIPAYPIIEISVS
jgi:hypothetical protein